MSATRPEDTTRRDFKLCDHVISSSQPAELAVLLSSSRMPSILSDAQIETALSIFALVDESTLAPDLRQQFQQLHSHLLYPNTSHFQALDLPLPPFTTTSNLGNFPRALLVSLSFISDFLSRLTTLPFNIQPESTLTCPIDNINPLPLGVPPDIYNDGYSPLDWNTSHEVTVCHSCLFP